MTKNVIVDESMIPYYGKFGQKLKRRMSLKPIRFGYKVWCLNHQGGYLYNFEMYQGKGSKNEYTDDFGFGPSVVIGFIKFLPKGNFSAFIDNYFNSIPEVFESIFMRYLKKENIDCTDTVKTNMSQYCPLAPKIRKCLPN